MVLNWLYNWKYTKQQVASAILIQKHIRGFLDRQRVRRKINELELQQEILFKWMRATKCSKEIEAQCNITTLDFEKTLGSITDSYFINRIYQKKRGKLVEQILDLDRYVKQLENDGDQLPRRMFPHSELCIRGKKIVAV